MAGDDILLEAPEINRWQIIFMAACKRQQIAEF